MGEHTEENSIMVEGFTLLAPGCSVSFQGKQAPSFGVWQEVEYHGDSNSYQRKLLILCQSGKRTET